MIDTRESLIRRASSNSHGYIEQKAPQSALIKEQIEAFLAQGGKIDKCCNKQETDLSGIYRWSTTPVLTQIDYGSFQAASILGISESHLRKLVRLGKGPQHREIQGANNKKSFRFTMTALKRYMEGVGEQTEHSAE